MADFSTAEVRPYRIYYGWWIVATAVMATIAYGFATLCLPVFYPEFVKTFGWSRASIAGGGSLRLLLGSAMAPINGILIDRFGAKAVLIGGALGTGLCLALFSFVNSLPQYYLLCFLLGMFVSGIYLLPNHLVVANWFVKNRGLPIGLVSTGTGLGGAIIPLLATYLIAMLNWRGAFLALAFFMALPLLMIILVMKEKPEEALPEPRREPRGSASHAPTGPPGSAVDLPLGEVLKNPSFWILCFGVMLIAAAMFGAREHMVLFFRGLHYSPAVSAAVLSSILVLSILGRFISGPLSDKFSVRRVIVLSFLLVAVSLLMLLSESDLLLRYLFPILFGVNYGAIINLKPLIIFDSFGGRKVGKVYGIVTGCFLFGSAWGPFLTGHIFDQTHNYRLPFVVNLILACVALIAIVVFACQAQPERRRSYAGGKVEECSRT